MYKNLYRRMRVLLHRYPLLPFLLAATLAVDVVGVFLQPSLYNQVNSRIEQLFNSFYIAQSCLLAIWVVHRFQGHVYRLLVTVMVVKVYLYLYEPFEGGDANNTITIVMIVAAMSHLLVNRISNITTNEKIEIPNFDIRALLMLTTSIAIGVYFLSRIVIESNMHSVVAPGIGCLVSTLLWQTSFSSRWSVRLLSPLLCFTLLNSLFLSVAIIGYLGPQSSVITETLFRFLIISYSLLGMSIGLIGFTLTWAYGLQVRRHPIRQRKKKQQATPSESEQPVVLKVVNQDEEPTEPPGPIDLTV